MFEYEERSLHLSLDHADEVSDSGSWWDPPSVRVIFHKSDTERAPMLLPPLGRKSSLTRFGPGSCVEDYLGNVPLDLSSPIQALGLKFGKPVAKAWTYPASLSQGSVVEGSQSSVRKASRTAS